MIATTATAPGLSLDQLVNIYQQVKADLSEKYKDNQKWLLAQGAALSEVKQAAQQVAAAGTLLGSVILAKPSDVQMMDQVQPDPAHTQLAAQVNLEEHQAIMAKMKTYVQMPAGHLPTQDELYLEQQLTDMLGFPVTANLDGHQLNQSIGVMGGEQHLMRYPTDDISQHDSIPEAGMAPNRGAFGWFTDQGQLTPDAILKEKYYFAVQTMYLPDWNTNSSVLKPWYKFRKMIVINPADEMAVVGVVGDAGPAQWVQKQFGGSPEVIREGEIWSKASRGHVILLFVDDPTNQVPLGPIDLSSAKQLAGV